jgi:hypothetical protein
LFFLALVDIDDYSGGELLSVVSFQFSEIVTKCKMDAGHCPSRCQATDNRELTTAFLPGAFDAE